MDHSLQFPAVTDPNQSVAWVVDIASRRVIRGHASLGQVPVEVRIGQNRPAKPACPMAGDNGALHDASGVAPQGGGVRAGTVGNDQHHSRYETVSRPEQNAASFTWADVGVRAYHIYCARGQGNGLDVDDWLEAERQLRAEAGIADRAPATTATPANPTRPG